MTASAPESSPAERQAAGRRRGCMRMRELAAQYADQRRELVAELLAGLGRTPTALDRIAAENLASLHVMAVRLDAAGKNASGIRQQITQMMRATGLKPAPIEPAKRAHVPISERWRNDEAVKPEGETVP